jgi:1-acyl-sn-glycerol-3-phosphate acyltransferase
MGDPFYLMIRAVGSGIFWMSSRPVVLHRERVPARGPYIMAANHHSPYDVAMMIRHTPAFLDFVSINEVFAYRFPRWFYGSMNAFPIDRFKPDRAGVRTILERLGRGRIIAMFPEGFIRKPPKSVTHGGDIRPGVGRLAHMANVPVVPCVVVNADQYNRIRAWLPVKRNRYAVVYGTPLTVRKDLPAAEAATQLETQLKAALVACYREAATALNWSEPAAGVAEGHAT